LRINGKQFDLLSSNLSASKLMLEVGLASYPAFADFSPNDSITLEVENGDGTKSYTGIVNMLLRQSDRLYVEFHIGRPDRSLQSVNVNQSSST
jgi:hypothetical protein